MIDSWDWLTIGQACLWAGPWCRFFTFLFTVSGLKEENVHKYGNILFHFDMNY